MSWWKRLTGAKTERTPAERVSLVTLALPGWKEEAPTESLRIWRDPEGAVLSLAMPDPFSDFPSFSDEAAVQRWTRSIGEDRPAGLIEGRVVTGALGPSIRLIYKRLQKPAYIFTGMLIVPRKPRPVVLTVVAGEQGTTGVREAVITSELFSSGKLNVESYKRSWARDPYDADYNGVDRSLLRFVSDHEQYDERFPDHPLSKVRRVLDALPSSLRIQLGT